MFSWTKSQISARSHQNVLAASSWLNKLYHVRPGTTVEGVDLSVPLSYADRFRIRKPGVQWNAHPPHVDGKSFDVLNRSSSNYLIFRWNH